MNWYEILEVKEDDTLETITKNYRKLALKYHPDKKGGDSEKFKILLNAYHYRLKFPDTFIEYEITFRENEDSVHILEFFYNCRLVDEKITFQILKEQATKYSVLPFEVTKESCISTLFARISSMKIKEKLYKLSIPFESNEHKDLLINRLLFSRKLTLKS